MPVESAESDAERLARVRADVSNIASALMPEPRDAIQDIVKFLLDGIDERDATIRDLRVEVQLRAAVQERTAAAYDDLRAEVERTASKLAAGTLHVATCNADHEAPIGCDACSCPPGREIKRLRAEVERLRAGIGQMAQRYERIGDAMVACRPTAVELRNLARSHPVTPSSSPPADGVQGGEQPAAENPRAGFDVGNGKVCEGDPCIVAGHEAKGVGRLASALHDGDAEVVWSATVKWRQVLPAPQPPRQGKPDVTDNSTWKPGMPRCCVCDSGLNADWAFCPYCSTEAEPPQIGREAVGEADATARAIARDILDRLAGLTGEPDEIVCQASVLEHEIAAALLAHGRAERERCALAARGHGDHSECGHGEGYIDGRLDAEAAIRSLAQDTSERET